MLEPGGMKAPFSAPYHSGSYSTYYYYPSYPRSWPVLPRFPALLPLHPATCFALFLCAFAFLFGLSQLVHRILCPTFSRRLREQPVTKDTVCEPWLHWHSYVVSTFHAAVCTVLGVLLFFFDDASGRWHPDAVSATFGEFALRDLCMLFTSAYLLYDLFFVARSYRKPDVLIVLHHALIIAAFSLALYFHIGTFYCAAFVLNECSTLFLNANFFMAAAPPGYDGLKGGVLYRLNGVALLVVYFAGRVLYNAYLVLHIFFVSWKDLQWMWNGDPGVTAPFVVGMAFLLSMLALGHAAINLVWFAALLKAVHRKLCKNSPARAEKKPTERAAAMANIAAEAAAAATARPAATVAAAAKSPKADGAAQAAAADDDDAREFKTNEGQPLSSAAAAAHMNVRHRKSARALD